MKLGKLSFLSGTAEKLWNARLTSARQCGAENKVRADCQRAIHTKDVSVVV